MCKRENSYIILHTDFCDGLFIMKKIAVTLGVAAAVLATVAYASHSQAGDKPDYVIAAENTTNNLLQYTYGPGKCISSGSPQGAWDMTCSYQDGDHVMHYSVTPAKADLRKNSGNFVLESQNDLAAETAAQGLTRYLGIRTTKVSGV